MSCSENTQTASAEFRVYSAAGGATEIKEIFVRLAPPSLEDGRSDLRRLVDSVKNEYGIEIVSADPDAVRSLPAAARDADWQLTCVLSPEPERGHKLIGLRRHDKFLSEETI